MQFRKISDTHYWTPSRSITLGGDGHDLTLGEHGWECSRCPGFSNRHSCEHVKQLLLKLNGPALITPARLAVRRAEGNGDDLVSIFNYASTYQPTNHAKVVVRMDRRPIVCGRCGTENPPEAQVCKNCANLPVEAAMTRSA